MTKQPKRKKLSNEERETQYEVSKTGVVLVLSEDHKKTIRDLYSRIMQNFDDRLNVFEDEVDLPKVNTEWNEYYLITFEGKAVGTFRICKYAVARVAQIYCLWIDPNYRGNVLFSVVTDFVGNRVFRDLGYDKIQANAISCNELANQLYSKELKLEGVQRNTIYARSQKFNTNLYGLLKEESRYQS